MATVIPKINSKDTLAFIKGANIAQLVEVQGQIEALAKTVSEHLEQRKAVEKDHVRSEIEALAKANGFTLAEFVNKQTRKGGSGDVLYRNPADASQTWSGRGRKPRWLTELQNENEAKVAASTVDSEAIAPTAKPKHDGDKQVAA